MNRLILIVLISLCFVECIKGQFDIPSGTNGSSVWGLRGEKWNRAVLLDWSWSGYGAKDKSYPDPPVVANVLDFGAKGDGVFDNTGPIYAAIGKAKQVGGGTVLIPAGRYLLTDRIVIDADNIVLKGAGPNMTTLFFPESLSAHDHNSIVDFKNVTNPYSWMDGWIQIKGIDPGSSDASSLLGSVTVPAAMGDRQLTVTSTDKMQVGQYVRLLMSDVNGYLVKELYGNIVNSSACAQSQLSGNGGAKSSAGDNPPTTTNVGSDECTGGMVGQADLIRWVVRIAAIQGNVITLQRALPIRVDPAWKAGIYKIPDSVIKESGIRELSVEFPWTPAAPHLQEKGYNAIFVDNAVNAFVLNVTTTNADTNVMVANSSYISVDGVTIQVTQPRGQTLPFDGHIGLGSYDSADVEFNNFNIVGEWIHDVTVRGTLMVVIHNGRGYNINLDAHRSAPYATLYSNINLGAGKRPYSTGGFATRGFPAARFTTYYNIRSNRRMPIRLPTTTMAGICTWGTTINALGYWNMSRTCPGYHVETFQYGSLQPRDLYGSMIDRKYSIRATGGANVPLLNSQPAIDGAAARSNVEPGIPLAGDGTYPIVNAPEIY